MRDLERWSEFETGLKNMLRPWWDEERRIWHIQRNFGGRWISIVAVFDVDPNATSIHDRRWVFRPLDNRTIVDLAAASLQQRFGTGDPEEDYELYKIEKEVAKEVAKELEFQGGIDKLIGIGEEAGPLWARAFAERDYGHGHGARMVYAVSGR